MVSEHLSTEYVEGEFPGHERGRQRLLPAAVERSKACHQFLQLERLHEVIVGTELKAVDSITEGAGG